MLVWPRLGEASLVDLLPEDDSHAVIPPTDEELEKLIATCEDFRTPAPLLPELVRFLAVTGLRRGEVCHLRWRSVDLAHDAIRIETQAKGRVINGNAREPKHGKFRDRHRRARNSTCCSVPPWIQSDRTRPPIIRACPRPRPSPTSSSSATTR